MLGGADGSVRLREAALDIVGGEHGRAAPRLAARRSCGCPGRPARRAMRPAQPRLPAAAPAPAGRLQLDEVPHAIAGQAQSLFEAGKLPGQRRQLVADRGHPRLALRDLAGDGAAADEPAAVVPRVKVAGAELAAHETLAGDRLALVAQLFQGLALDVSRRAAGPRRRGRRGGRFALRRPAG